MLNGIDVASHQRGINLAVVPLEFAIVKATGGTGYVNDDFERQVKQVLDSGRLLGIYHYAREIDYEGSAAQEAAFFLEKFAPYKGKAVPCLDWENNALLLPVSWAREWLDIVARETGATPFFYSGAGYINSTNCTAITKYPLWKASYLSRYAGGGYVDEPVDIWDDGDWSSKKVYQYTSEGRLAGWSSNLDINKFYGTKSEWDKFCGKQAKQEPGKAKNDAGLKYHVHVQDVGDLATVRDGQTAGTVGFSKRMEGITFDVIPKGFKLRCKLHLEGIGWRSYDVVPGKLLGTKGESRRVECIGFEVVERPAGDKRKLYFQVHQQDFGWLADTKEGYFSGCDGQSRRLEAVRIWLA